MTEAEIQDAAGIVIKDNKITKIKGKILKGTVDAICDGEPEVTLKIALIGGIYNKSGESVAKIKDPIELVDISEAQELTEEANETIAKWKLPGVSGISDLKKAPAEIFEVALNVVTNVIRHPDLPAVCKRYQDEIDKIEPGAGAETRMFAMMLVYDTLGFPMSAIKDDITKKATLVFSCYRDRLSDDLKCGIEKIEKDARTDL